jgi:TrkA domain protein
VPNVEETKLPGVGVRFAFTTSGGERLGVIAHRSGRRELLVYGKDDPDACGAVVRLDDGDARTLVDLLGGSEVSERLDAVIRQSLDGLELEWVELAANSPSVGKAIADLGLRSSTGASIVTVVRGGEAIPSPRSDFRMHEGDTVVIVGSLEAIEQATAILRGV